MDSVPHPFMYVVEPHSVRESHVETFRDGGSPTRCHYAQVYSSKRVQR